MSHEQGGAVSGTTFSGSGASLTSLNASNPASGTVATGRLGSGTANSSTFLRGDQTWATPTASVADGDKGDITVSSSGAVWVIDSGVVTNAMLAGSTAASKLVGTDIVTVGTITAGAWNANGMTINGTAGRNYFKDSELSSGTGLRVGAAWGMYGIYAENGAGVVGGASGVNLQNGSMIVDTSGNVGIGTASPQSPLHVNGGATIATTCHPSFQSSALNIDYCAAAGGARLAAYTTGGVSTNLLLNPYGGNVGIGTNNPTRKLHVAGDMFVGSAFNDCPGGWSCMIHTWDVSLASLYYSGMQQRSDRRFKHDISSLTASDTDRLLHLRPIAYKWNEGKGPLGQQYGFVAQEVEAIWPDLVATATDELQTKSVNYMSLIAPMLNALRELKAENGKLRDELKADKDNWKAANDNQAAALKALEAKFEVYKAAHP